jgi:hypothetical protein
MGAVGIGFGGCLAVIGIDLIEERIDVQRPQAFFCNDGIVRGHQSQDFTLLFQGSQNFPEPGAGRKDLPCVHTLIVAVEHHVCYMISGSGTAVPGKHIIHDVADLLVSSLAKRTVHIGDTIPDTQGFHDLGKMGIIHGKCLKYIFQRLHGNADPKGIKIQKGSVFVKNNGIGFHNMQLLEN